MLIRKDQLNLVPDDHPILKSPPDLYDFKDADGEFFSNILFARMKELGGVGLSANQVGVNARVFVMGLDDVTRINVFNPEIVEYLGEEVSLNEGCLTFPGLFMFIKRPQGVRVKYQDQNGEVCETILTGLTARIFQHEYDHMMGTLFVDKVSKLKLDLAKKKYSNKRKRIIRKHAINTLVKAIKDGDQNSTGVR